MGLGKIDFLDDRVRVFYHLDTSYFCDDINSMVDVMYKDVSRLEPEPERIGFGENTVERVMIPKLNQTISFIIDRYQERSWGPLEEQLYGPYIAKEPFG